LTRKLLRRQTSLVSRGKPLIGAGVAHHGQSLSFLEREPVADQLQSAFLRVTFRQQQRQIGNRQSQIANCPCVKQLLIRRMRTSMNSLVRHI